MAFILFAFSCLYFLNVFSPLKCSVVCLQQESLGPNGGFSYYVFEQLHKTRQFCELLRLGEEFPDELNIFLKGHPDLLWLHELFLHQFSLASETLHGLALTQDKESTSVAEEKELEDVNLKLNLSERKHLLYLSKIAAVAGNYFFIFSCLMQMLLLFQFFL